MSNTRFNVLNLIRDSRDLSHGEKVFLYTVETRNEMYGRWKTNAADMGMKKDRYFKVRKSLVDKNLLEVRRRMDSTTIYSVSENNLIQWTHDHSSRQNTDSQSENEYSDGTNSDSDTPETKVTPEDNSLSTPMKVTKSDLHSSIEGDVEPVSETQPTAEPSGEPNPSIAFENSDSTIQDSAISNASSRMFIEEPDDDANLFDPGVWKVEPERSPAGRTSEAEETWSEESSGEEPTVLVIPNPGDYDDIDVYARVAAPIIKRLDRLCPEPKLRAETIHRTHYWERRQPTRHLQPTATRTAPAHEEEPW